MEENPSTARKETRAAVTTEDAHAVPWYSDKEGVCCTIASPMDESEIIKEGDMVIFDVNGQMKVNFVEAKRGSTFSLGRGVCQGIDLVGHPYGTLFELNTPPDNVRDDQEQIDQSISTIRPVAHQPNMEWMENGEQVVFQTTTTHTSHKITHSASNQNLTQADIESLKEKTDGSSIVDALVTHSNTYDMMSDFAQKKYKKRKVDKYVLVGCARKPTAAALAEAYYSKQASRIGGLRPDTLALVLNMANVGPYQNVLVLEASSGLVTGAVAERLGGYGEVCAAHFGRNPTGIAISNFFNFDERTKSTIHTKPLFALLEEVGGLCTKSKFFTDKKYSDDEEEQDNQADSNETVGVQQGRFTSCVITSTNYSAKSSLLAVFPLLAPSATFAIASPLLQPLVDCMNLIRVKGYAVSTEIHEAWMRDIQVLPKRTHPAMNMNHGGGYILTGTVTKKGRWIDLNNFKQEQKE